MDRTRRGRRRGSGGRPALAGLLGLVLTATGACSLPRDARGALDRATGGELRVGVSVNPPFTILGPDGTPGGPEARLVSDYAASIGARVDWTVGAESVLVDQVTDSRLDLVIGGLQEDTVWAGDLALTKPYDPDNEQPRVLGATPGENALLVSVERFLIEEEG